MCTYKISLHHIISNGVFMIDTIVCTFWIGSGILSQHTLARDWFSMSLPFPELPRNFDWWTVDKVVCHLNVPPVFGLFPVLRRSPASLESSARGCALTGAPHQQPFVRRAKSPGQHSRGRMDEGGAAGGSRRKRAGGRGRGPLLHHLVPNAEKMWSFL